MSEFVDSIAFLARLFVGLPAVFVIATASIIVLTPIGVATLAYRRFRGDGQ